MLDLFYTTVDYTKWRLAYSGGRNFISTYLQRYSTRETTDLFDKRKQLSYSPTFARREINKIINQIACKLCFVRREGGNSTYQDAVNSNIDLQYTSMNTFIATDLLRELCVMSKVGCLLDMPSLDSTLLSANVNKHPYVSLYTIEQIAEYRYTNNYDLSYLVLLQGEDCVEIKYETVPEGVLVSFSDSSSQLLNIPTIPFHILDIGFSFIEDLADYQIALMNIESSDLGFILLANFPFYTEQYLPSSQSQYLKKQMQASDGTKEEPIKVGTTEGRTYAHPTERPDFIAPPIGPLEGSMAKQAAIKADMLALLNDSVDGLGNGEGLAFIGSILQRFELKMAEFWCNFMRIENNIRIQYPTTFEKRTPEQVRVEIAQLLTLSTKVPSPRFQKEVSKRLSCLVFEGDIGYDTLETIGEEVDTAKFLTSDPDIVAKDLEAGLVSLELASKARGYPEGEVEKAAKDHADRLARIAISQTQGIGAPEARGLPDLGGDPKAGVKERLKANQTVTDPVVSDKTRGKNK